MTSRYKDATNIMDKLKYIDELGYKYCFQYTITPYESDIEQNLREKKQIINNFKMLSSIIGKERMIWRYDPIIVNKKYSLEYHMKTFEKMCESLAPYAERIVFSFIDLYNKIRISDLQEISMETMNVLTKELGNISRENNIKIQSCCEKIDCFKYGILQEGCLSKTFIEKVCGYKLNLKQDKGQRGDCQCVESIDIGAYNTCLNSCTYCYANGRKETALKNYQNHNPSAEFLLGERKENDKIYYRKQKSNRC